MGNTDSGVPSQVRVQTTQNYDKFKILVGNRDINQVNLKRLKSSFKEHYLFSPILVNEKMQIIDGQHRFLAAKELQLPVHYIMISGYGLEEVQVLNTNTSNWKKIDYLKAYCDLGIKPYLQMRQFMLDYPDFGVGVSEVILSGNSWGTTKGQVMENVKVVIDGFQSGKLSIPDLDIAYDVADCIMQFKPLYDGYNRRSFVYAIIALLKNENYNHDEMLHKIMLSPTALTHCTNRTQYKILLEEIYNRNRRVKVSIRY